MASRALQPGEHLVDAGYVTAERLIDRQREEIDLIEPVPPEPGWQAKAGDASPPRVSCLIGQRSRRPVPEDT
ncbi:MAG: hypothetical protein EOM24_00875 [Chloroflexia bacterium]|nr:hypothetical protein [Chloroflexia bacterium]